MRPRLLSHNGSLDAAGTVGNTISLKTLRAMADSFPIAEGVGDDPRSGVDEGPGAYCTSAGGSSTDL